jgi:hypothetical protein
VRDKDSKGARGGRDVGLVFELVYLHVRMFIEQKVAAALSLYAVVRRLHNTG